MNKDFIKFYKENIETKNYVEILENEIKNKFNSKYAVACSSGTAAIHCALLSLDIKEGDEVIVPNLTVIMTIMPIIYIGAIPVFVDCGKDTIDFDYEDLESKITPKTKAIIPVYMWGLSYNIDKLKSIAKKHNLKIIEDACQAQGSKYRNKYLGTFGEMGCFSLKDGKIVSSGEGGYILTNSKKYYKKLINLRNHQIAYNPEKSFQKIGYNYRLTNVQAYLAIASLENFDKAIIHRKDICSKFYNSTNNLDNLANKQTNTNYFSPLILLKNGDRNKLKLLSNNNVFNSVGSFGLKPASERLSIKNYLKNKGCNYNIKTMNCKNLLNKLLAIAISNDYNYDKVKYDIEKIKGISNE